MLASRACNLDVSCISLACFAAYWGLPLAFSLLGATFGLLVGELCNCVVSSWVANCSWRDVREHLHLGGSASAAAGAALAACEALCHGQLRAAAAAGEDWPWKEKDMPLLGVEDGVEVPFGHALAWPMQPTLPVLERWLHDKVTC